LSNLEDINTSREEPSEEFQQRLVKTKPGHGYNLTVGRSPKFIWYRNAKVATRTTLSTLDQAGLTYQVRQIFGVEYNPIDPSSYFKFAFVRNPWDRLISGWQNKIVRQTIYRKKWYTGDTTKLESFVDFLETLDLSNCDPHFRLQTQLIPLDLIDFIGRFENFDIDLKNVLAQLGLNAEIQLEQKNASETRVSYQEYFTPELRKRVEKLYEDDIKTFEYEF
jgi:hypothetical protein